jgi:hypothetical protein
MEIIENPQALFGFASKWWRYQRKKYTEVEDNPLYGADYSGFRAITVYF